VVPHQRIVSLVPSLTELLFWLDAGERVVGRTKFCTEPASEVEHIPSLGGTKNPDVDRILALRPDLVVANKEENRREDIEALEAAGLRVMVTDPNSVPQAIEMVLILGGVVGAAEKAEVLALDIALALASVPEGEAVPVYVGVWHYPMMGLGSESYGHSLIEACGGRNVLAGRPRYPETSLEELRSLNPSLILLPDEPFPFDAGHATLYGEIAPALVIDGKLLWWYGPRMPEAIAELSALLAGKRAELG
jgi:ABC-type Fe3+-hydroxamate transport system substrate-binding protein